MRNNQLCVSYIGTAVSLLLVLFLCQPSFGQDFPLGKIKYVKDTSRFANAKKLYNRARRELNEGNGEEALRFYLKTIDEYNGLYESSLANSDYKEAVNALLEKADVERRIYPDSTPYITLSKAQNLLSSHIPSDDFLWFKTYLSIGRVAHTKSDFYSAIDYLDSAQILYSNSVEYDSVSYRDLMEYKFYDYLYSKKSIDTVERYIDLRLKWEYENQKKKFEPAKVLYILEDYPDIYFQKGEYDIALAYAISNYKYYNQNKKFIQNKERYGEVYFDLALALFRKDQLDKALNIAFEYLNADKSLIIENKKSEMITLVGLIYNGIGNHEKSISYFERFLNTEIESFDEQEQKNQKIARATALLNMGINLYELGRVDEAIENYNRSLDEMRSIVGFPSTDLVNCYRYIGDFYVQEGLWQKALVSYDSALRNTELKYSNELLEFPIVDSTSRFSLESLTILKKKSNAIFHNYSKNPREYLEAVINYVDKTHEKIRSNREGLYKSDGKLFLSQFFKDLYETGIDACFQLFEMTGEVKYAWHAFHYAQQSKSNLFLEQEKDYKEFTSSDIPYSLKETYYLTTGRLENLKSLLYNALDNSVTGDSVLRLSDEILELETRTSSLRDSISENYTITAHEDRKNGIVNSLENESVLIEFFYGQNSIYSFGINSDENIAFNKTENNSLLRSNLEGFHQIVSAPPNYEKLEEDISNYKSYAFNLFNLLIRPALDGLGGAPRELVIVPDEFLTRIPFEALITKSDEGRSYHDFNYLINGFKVRYLISSNVQKRVVRAIENDYKILGIGFSNVSNGNQKGVGYAALPGTEREIQFLEASFQGDFYLGEQGSRKRFLSEAMNYDIIHLAIHGKADSSNRFQSSLIFNGSDSLLNTNQLYLANIHAQLAVLSACESGMGQIESGEGTFSIARGFAIVGVPNVVMSLWEVNDRTTSSQMVKFYQKFLDEKKDLNSSLREVKLDYIKDGDSYLSHPYFWASFIHLGQNTDVKGSFFQENKTWLGIFTLMIILGAIASLLALKKRKGIF